MDIGQLRDYRNWIGKTPGDVLVAVKNVGGWQNIFTQEAFKDTPTGLPRWAHRIRNFFNQEPVQLTYDKFIVSESDIYKLGTLQVGSDFKKDLGLSGHTYLDENKNTWLQMTPGSTVYHFAHGSSMEWMAYVVTISGQSKTPVFKLVYLDGSKGSCETIIRNPFTTKYKKLGSFVGGLIPGGNLVSIPTEEGESIIKEKSVKNRIVANPAFQGSYNYGDTIVVGSDTHKRYDVTPHEKDPAGYIKIDDRHSSIFSRKFEEYAKGEKNTPLAEQIKYS